MDEMELRLECLKLVNHPGQPAYWQIQEAQALYDFIRGMASLPETKRTKPDSVTIITDDD